MHFTRTVSSVSFKAVLILSLSISACAEVSPWANMVSFRHRSLTLKNLKQLNKPDEIGLPFKVGLISDPQILPGYLRSVSSHLNKRSDLDFTIILGDLTDRSLKNEFLWVADVVKDSRLPTLTIVGNHDGLMYGEGLYKEIFGPLNYTFTYRGIKFIMWNNNPYEWGYPDFHWLTEEIDSHPHVIIVAHQPPGSIERYPEANEELHKIYEHPHVLGSVHGHTHFFNFTRIAEKPVVTVARVLDETYAIMSVDAQMQLTFEPCRGWKCNVPESF